MKKVVKTKTPGTVNKPINVKIPEKTEKAVAVREKSVNEKSENKEQVTEGKKVPPDGALLQIKEGNFKYSRIPGIVLKESEKSQENDFVHISAENLDDPEKQSTNIEEKGFLGLEKKTADWVAKIGLALLLLIIFLLYRVRSRSSRSVHRSFPK